jgi:hypothetical protein
MSFSDHYSALDRTLHRVAFSGWAAQRAAADVESALFRERYRSLEVDRPVFITSLPRAGTTLLLELLAGLPECATHSYRDMPFVLAPLLWDRLSGGVRAGVSERERAHADGVTIGIDSPEAFEEVLWRAFWPAKYGRDAIEPWREDESHPDFERFFRDHIRKLVALRADPPEAGRYVSKNNGNIARIGLLRRLFPDAALVVPFRAPDQHAASMLQQHRRFCEIHEREPFSRRYMHDIGHFEFGALHRPFAFADPLPVVSSSASDPHRDEYWLGYWIRTFHALLDEGDSVHFISYERLCEDPRTALAALEEALGLPEGRLLRAAGDRIRLPRTWAGANGAPPATLDAAETLHQQLLDRSLV